MKEVILNREIIAGIFGVLFPGGIAIWRWIESTGGVISWLCGLVSLFVGIATFILIINKIKTQRSQRKVYDRMIDDKNH